MTAYRSASPSQLDAYIQDLVACLLPLPYVSQLLLDDAGNEPVMWIVIDAPPFDRGFRDPIYQIDLQVSLRHPEVTIPIRLLNVAECGADRLPTLLPVDARTVFRR